MAATAAEEEEGGLTMKEESCANLVEQNPNPKFWWEMREPPQANIIINVLKPKNKNKKWDFPLLTFLLDLMLNLK